MKSYMCGKNAILDKNAVIGKYFDKKNNFKKTIIGDSANIRSGTIIYYGNRIGDNFQTGHNVLIRQNNIIGNNVSVGSHTEIAFNTRIEDGVRIHSNVFIPEKTILRKNCWIGPGVVITNSKYPHSKDSKKKLKGVEIEENVKIGANSTILPGIKIRKNSLIGAGSVVTKDVNPDSVYMGNPARFFKKIEELKDSSGEKIYD